MSEEQIYRQLYDEEANWRHQLADAIGIPIGLASVLGGVLALYLRAFPGWNGIVGWWFGVAVSAAVVCFMATVIQLVRTRYGYTYERIPFPKQIREYEEGLKAYHQAVGSEHTAEFREWLNNCYVAAADRNLQNDVRKSHHLHWAMT